jgi:hypothetical protein
MNRILFIYKRYKYCEIQLEINHKNIYLYYINIFIEYLNIFNAIYIYSKHAGGDGATKRCLNTANSKLRPDNAILEPPNTNLQQQSSSSKS